MGWYMLVTAVVLQAESMDRFYAVIVTVSLNLMQNFTCHNCGLISQLHCLASP